MIHVGLFVLLLIFLLLCYMFSGVIKQAFLGTKKDIEKVESKLEEENKSE